jgi:hypothetical protein
MTDKEDTPGIYVDEENNQIVFDYDELDEDSQKTLDRLSDYFNNLDK